MQQQQNANNHVKVAGNFQFHCVAFLFLSNINTLFINGINCTMYTHTLAFILNIRIVALAYYCIHVSSLFMSARLTQSAI